MAKQKIKQINIPYQEALKRCVGTRLESWELKRTEDGNQQLELTFEDPVGDKVMLAILPNVALKIDGRGGYITVDRQFNIALCELQAEDAPPA